MTQISKVSIQTLLILLLGLVLLFHPIISSDTSEKNPLWKSPSYILERKITYHPSAHFLMNRVR